MCMNVPSTYTFPELDRYYTRPAQPITTTGWDLDYLEYRSSSARRVEKLSSVCAGETNRICAAAACRLRPGQTMRCVMTPPDRSLCALVS